MDIIASGSHNGGGLDMTILNGLQSGLTRAQAASLRGLGASVPPEGEGGSAFGILWLFAIFGGVGYLAYRSDEKKRRNRRK